MSYADGHVGVFALDRPSTDARGFLTPIASWALHAVGAPHDGNQAMVTGGVSFSPLNHKFMASAGRDGKLVFTDFEQHKVSFLPQAVYDMYGPETESRETPS